VQVRKRVDGVRTREIAALKVIEFADSHAHPRHGLLPNGEPRPYKGYKGDSNYCIEIVRNEKGKWEGEVVSTFEAYQLVRQHGLARLRHPALSVSGRPLVMRLMIGDTLALTSKDDSKMIARITKISGNGQIFMASHNEANVDFRNRDRSDPFAYVSKMAGSLQKAQGRRVGISPIGELRDHGAFI
jgi:CRISPR-associated endonuclease Csn1